MNRNAATLNRPARKEPVDFRKYPIQYGPKPLPRLPSALIKAILTAALAFGSFAEAIAQNGPVMEEEAARAIANAATLNAMLNSRPARMRANTPARALNATCQRRSPVRSECADRKSV